jgi:sulfite reductase (NADPH) hemoprotein beta-component
MRQWSTFHPEFAFLPRKFKIAITGTPSHDRAAIRFHDIGVRLVQNEAGQTGFEIWVGGGLGRTPFVATAIRGFLEYEHLLSYLEAILRVYNLHGRRDNKFKARIKILVSELGAEEFTRQVEAEWAQIKDSALRLERREIERVARQFEPPAYEKLPAADLTALALKAAPDYGRWLRNNVKAHKVPGYAIVFLSLKKDGIPPGDISDTQLDEVAALADRFSFGQVVATHTQNLVLTDVRASDLPALHQELVRLDMATPNAGLLTDIICCPGLDYCTLANARSIPIALAIQERFDDIDYLNDVGPCSIKISGCINACGHHHIGNIGILGIDKHGEEAYQLMLGGNDSDSASIGKVLGRALESNEVVDAVARVLETYLAVRTDTEETFLECYRRLGPAPFKDAVYPAEAAQ